MWGWWRHLLLAGLVAGLLGASFVPAPSGWLPCALAGVAALSAAAIHGRERGGFSRTAASAGLAAAAVVAALIGLGLGSARIAAIDAGALRGAAGEPVDVRGWVSAPLRRSFGEVRIQLDAREGRVGRVIAVAAEPVPDLEVGSEVAVRGRLREPDDFRAAEMERAGAALELAVERLRLTGARRGGVAGALDDVRGRAEAALGDGLDAEQEALARGFVLGQDDRIDPIVTGAVPPFRAQPSARRVRAERRPARDPRRRRAGDLRAVPAGPAAGHPPADRRLRADRRGRSFDPASRRDGSGGGRRDARRPARRARLPAAAGRGGDAPGQSAVRRRRRLAAQLRGGARDHALGRDACAT